ncbi:hypothetical protein EBBID32_6800 [Sphingobium indicum BiD32]|uniref:Uncharacterized protein n=1 Tax=Sphingobium indicum BiD32 TaxID=1301087 RepID=N1MHT6_9SPHN|nr:hypothetical protein EBBID32_6800 [Sphingobium indicum BiD32]
MSALFCAGHMTKLRWLLPSTNCRREIQSFALWSFIECRLMPAAEKNVNSSSGY